MPTAPSGPVPPNPTTSPRTGITGPDSAISSLQPYPCAGAEVVQVGAECDTPGQKLTFRVIFWDALGQLVAGTKQVVFTSDSVAYDGSLYIGQPDPEAWFPAAGSSIYGIHVDAVTGGVWKLTTIAA